MKFTIRPKIDRIELDFGKDKAVQIVNLLAKSDASIVSRELETKSFYELTGQYPIKLGENHVEL